MLYTRTYILLYVNNISIKVVCVCVGGVFLCTLDKESTFFPFKIEEP